MLCLISHSSEVRMVARCQKDQIRPARRLHKRRLLKAGKFTVAESRDRWTSTVDTRVLRGVLLLSTTAYPSAPKALKREVRFTIDSTGLENTRGSKSPAPYRHRFGMTDRIAQTRQQGNTRD